MRRKLLMVVLGVGAVAGFASGFARLCHGGHGPFGHGGRFDRHAELQRRVADACTESALRVYQQQPSKAGQAP
jgi:hypothetical protein